MFVDHSVSTGSPQRGDNCPILSIILPEKSRREHCTSTRTPSVHLCGLLSLTWRFYQVSIKYQRRSKHPALFFCDRPSFTQNFTACTSIEDGRNDLDPTPRTALERERWWEREICRERERKRESGRETEREGERMGSSERESKGKRKLNIAGKWRHREREQSSLM